MFTRQTLDFLSENLFMNDRYWFDENRERYKKYVIEPMTELCSAIAPTISAIDAQIVTEPRTDRVFSRIYRDMRRVRDGMFYRDEMWLSFKRDKVEFPHYPEFYFVYSPRGFFYGCGYYQATGEAMDAMRKLVLNGDRRFCEADAALKNMPEGCFEGQKFKRPRYPDRPENERIWLESKDIAFSYRESDVEKLFAPELAETVAARYKAFGPIYSFFIAAETMKEGK